MYHYLSESKSIFRFILQRMKKYHKKTISEVFTGLLLFLMGNIAIFYLSNNLDLGFFIGLVAFSVGFLRAIYSKFRDDYLDAHAPK
ncbi:hypothetical protein [Pasteurella multocida]|uniref:hypothetical protein n=1 Tax=Pasteurella multocida TaxID=747 RepID=UPI00147F0E4C|nr:hypothetical protein [Pasteurella multocida]NNH97745.1 hypothetical protein [Pasteurella multocida]NNI42912.1 hypothetical protein [Pasteurella multocida]